MKFKSDPQQTERETTAVPARFDDSKLRTLAFAWMAERPKPMANGR